jgi:aspartyl-tRNA(Asn)/glutamyl-tRNA(Gln) amidotransferase subunit A
MAPTTSPGSGAAAAGVTGPFTGVSTPAGGIGAAAAGVTGPFTGVGVAQLGDRLRSGATSAVELTRQALAAARESQPALNAFATLDADGALAAAARADSELHRGFDRGPLHGIPVAVKDIIDTAGLTTAMGSRHFAGRVPERDAEVVARWRAAGVVVLGKTTTHEFAYGPTGDRAANGPCANPRDPARMAGGSSAGSAAAVGAGVVPLALGTDTGGSVRIPAALCGVAGLRPSFGRIPTAGVYPLSWSLDTVGPLAATVADLTLGWAALTGTAADGVIRGADPATLRIGLPTDPWFDRLAPGVRSALAGLVDRLAAAGARLSEVPVADVEELRHLYRVVQSVEAVSLHVERMAQAPELFEPEVLDRLRAAAQVPAWEYARSLGRLEAVRAQAARRLDGLDALLLPTVAVPAPPLGARDTELGGGWRSPRDALLAFTVPWSVLGLPAVSLPVASPAVASPAAASLRADGPAVDGAAADGAAIDGAADDRAAADGAAVDRLPVGAQLVGLPGGDDQLLRVAHTVELLAGGPR